MILLICCVENPIVVMDSEDEEIEMLNDDDVSVINNIIEELEALKDKINKIMIMFICCVENPIVIIDSDDDDKEIDETLDEVFAWDVSIDNIIDELEAVKQKINDIINQLQ